MMLEYVTIGGEMLDEICFNYYGTERGTIEKVLSLNKHVAELPLKLPPGVVISLPPLELSQTKKEIKLWD